MFSLFSALQLLLSTKRCSGLCRLTGGGKIPFSVEKLRRDCHPSSSDFDCYQSLRTWLVHTYTNTHKKTLSQKKKERKKERKAHLLLLSGVKIQIFNLFFVLFLFFQSSTAERSCCWLLLQGAVRGAETSISTPSSPPLLPSPHPRLHALAPPPLPDRVGWCLHWHTHRER